MGLKKANLVKRMSYHYKNILNRLDGVPGDEEFLNLLILLESDFQEYLYETLKSKKYGSNPQSTNVWKKYISGGHGREYLEELVSKEILNENVSIDSLLKAGVDRLNELFENQDTFDNALSQGLIQNVQLFGQILPSNTHPAFKNGSAKGCVEKEPSQKNFSLLVSLLINLGIYTNDIIIMHSSRKNKNILRKYSYIALYIPKVDKTIFFNPGYGEATYVCNCKVSIDVMTTYTKERLESDFGAIKIKFSDDDVASRKDSMKSALLGEGLKSSKTTDTSNFGSVKKSIEKEAALRNLIDFYNEYKDDSFELKVDDKVIKFNFKDVFSTFANYLKYRKYLSQLFPGMYFPGDVNHVFGLTWNEFKKKLGITDIHEFSFSSMQEIIDFFNNGDDSVKSMFNTYRSYLDSDKKAIYNKYKISLPNDIETLFKIFGVEKFSELKEKLGIINSLGIQKLDTKNDIIEFYNLHKDDEDIVKMFDVVTFYDDYLEIVNKKYNVLLPKLKRLKGIFGDVDKKGRIVKYAKWNTIKEALGITSLRRTEFPTKERIIDFYKSHEFDPHVVAMFYSTENYFSLYKVVNRLYSINLPGSVGEDGLGKIFGVKSWSDIQIALGIPVTRGRILSTREQIISFCHKYGDVPEIRELFSSPAAYQRLYKSFDGDKYNIKLPTDATAFRRKFGVKNWKEILLLLGFTK